MADQAITQSVKRHYQLFTGELSILEKDSQQINLIRLNAVSPMKSRNIAAQDLGIAQAAMQKQFMERMPPNWEGQVIEVIIMNISYLGEMTNEEFIHQDAPNQDQAEKEAIKLMESLGVRGAHLDKGV